MSIKAVNFNAGYRYQARAQTPNDEGELDTPPPGIITDLTVRLSLTATGEAIDPDLDNLAAAPEPDQPDLFFVQVSQALHVEHLKPLGRGKSYHAIWSRPDADNLTDPFITTDRDTI